MQHTFRPMSGQVLTATVAALGAVVLVATLWVDGVGAALRTAPGTLLVVGAVWALFWRPYVRVDDDGVELGNVLRTVRVPWTALREVDTRFALTLHTRSGGRERRFTAWAAPSSGRRTGRRVIRRDLRDAPDAIRAGDAPDSLSGRAAALVRRTWSHWLETAGQDRDGAPAPEPESRWHAGVLAGGALLAALTALSVLS